ncbi:7-cyano-7-deazaguanine synthase QueC [Gallaecimonas kandeliae]|uniref:7-cyano-7-deazaguanine synthase QueC n=1 Tax=Gallaecimonas kandeliae TaxID=3029055 RepID=UPI002647D9C6|nr:7-cyano-7-deazaguanine synthase QueC [Gallaecimonas kandeliae]WKE64307.1 7-cyano-7-deazaguanine synthase QueC [Gallaecimonas kandeliae]
MSKVVVIYSGGMDSFTLLHKAIKDGHEVHALSFNYGQRHVRELVVARQVTEELGIAHEVVDISAIQGLIANSALTSDMDMPEGHYAEANMKQTVVPNRNMILLSLAIGKAVSIGADKVYYGAHGGDHAIYPDCRPEFVKAMNAVSMVANYEPVGIESPYLMATKGEILTDGLKMGLDYSKSWTCYQGGEQACGRCGACQERLEAFRENGLEDPLPYLTREIL